MHKKNKKRAKPSVSLAHRKKYYFVTPDEDMRVLWSPNHYIAKYIVRIFKDYIPYNDSIGATPFCHEDENGMPWADYQAWHDCLEEMLYAFTYYANERHSEASDEEKARVQHGLALFAKHFASLWV